MFLQSYNFSFGDILKEHFLTGVAGEEDTLTAMVAIRSEQTKCRCRTSVVKLCEGFVYGKEGGLVLEDDLKKSKS